MQHRRTGWMIGPLERVATGCRFVPVPGFRCGDWIPAASGTGARPGFRPRLLPRSAPYETRFQRVDHRHHPLANGGPSVTEPGRSRTPTAAGTVATAVLVLAFGNQAFTEWEDRHAHNNTWGFFLRTLAWPRWAVGPSDSSNAAVRVLIANDLRAILLIVFAAAILAMSA